MKLKEGVSKVAATVYGLLAGVLGAAVSGGATAAVNYVQTNGETQDLKAVGGAAAAGAVLGAAMYFFPSPVKSKKE